MHAHFRLHRARHFGGMHAFGRAGGLYTKLDNRRRQRQSATLNLAEEREGNLSRQWQSRTLCAALDERRASLLARDPVIAEKHHGNEKAYLDKVVGSHNRAPPWTILEPLFNHGGLAIVRRKTSQIEQPWPKPTSGSAQIAKPNVRFRG
jgi:hypothetical protein